MHHLDRLPTVASSRWMSTHARHWRGALLTCLVIALASLATPWASVKEQFGEVHFPVSCRVGVQRAAKADWSALSYSIWVSASKGVVNPVSSDWPQPMPLTMRSS